MQKRKASQGSSQKKHKSDVSYHKKMNLYRPLEMKFLDTAVALSTIALGGTILSSSLNVVPQDDTQSGRTGRKIAIKKLNWHCFVLLPTAGTSAACHGDVRIIFYKDKQTNGAAATAANMFLSGGNTDILSWRAMANAERFDILSDKVYHVECPIGQVGANAGAENSRWMKGHYTFKKPLEITYDATAATGAIGTIRTNNLGCLVFSSGGVEQVSLVSRIKYSDL